MWFVEMEENHGADPSIMIRRRFIIRDYNKNRGKKFTRLENRVLSRFVVIKRCFADSISFRRSFGKMDSG